MKNTIIALAILFSINSFANESGTLVCKSRPKKGKAERSVEFIFGKTPQALMGDRVFTCWDEDSYDGKMGNYLLRCHYRIGPDANFKLLLSKSKKSATLISRGPHGAGSPVKFYCTE